MNGASTLSAVQKEKLFSSFFPYTEWFEFASPEDTGSNIIGLGGPLSADLLLSAYLQGVFPWYGSDDPVLWWSPDPRFVLLPLPASFAL